MTSGNVLAVGGTLSEGQFITDGSGNWFAGVIDRQFGVYAGTPESPIGTSITLCFPCTNVAMTATALTGFADRDDPTPAWTTPAGTGPCFAIMQADGNLCVYEGNGPADQGAFLWGSKQSGGLDHGFKPYPEFRATTVAVYFMDGDVTGSSWCIINPDGSEGEFTALNEMTVAGPNGGSCCLQARKPDGSDSHNSGDNFSIGEQNVVYHLSHDNNPFSPAYFSWSRIS